MLHKERDKALVQNIISAGENIQNFIETCEYKKFADSKKLRYAVERELLLIGEASRRLSEEYKDSVPGIPWNAAIGLRNIIAHDYGEVLAERIWLVASRDLPDLMKVLKAFAKSY